MPVSACARVVSLLAFLAVAGVWQAAAQVATGEIYGRVADATGAVLPGATVIIRSASLLQPLTAVTTETGSYRFPLIPIGTYNARFDLAGFRTVVNEGIRVETGLNVQIDVTLAVGGLEEVVEVTSGTPLIDRKDAGTTDRFTLERLQAVPSARDPWVIAGQSAGVAMDRQNVGGSSSGQQANFVVRGTARESKWSLDGVDITDMAATGSSPFYYDFDAFEEIQVTTGGADVTMQSSGLAINLVTRSGTDRFRGSGRYYVTDEAFQSNNVTDALRSQGVNTGNPIQNIKDYGIEAGGPIRKGRAWAWGGYGTNRIKVGVNNFYKPDIACQQIKTDVAQDPLSHSLDEAQACLMTDETTLETYNMKVALQTVRGNQFSFYFNAADKIRPTREASDLRPLETTVRQGRVTREDLGSSWWTIGIPKTYRWADRHVFNDRSMVEAQYAHVGANFATTFHEESLRSVQPAYEISTGEWSRSYQEAVNVRPADIVELTGNYLLPGVLGGDHALKFGFKVRNDLAYGDNTFGGDAVARFSRGVASQAQLYRRAIGEYALRNRSFYVQDSYTRRRVTITAGFRFDHQHDHTNSATVPASPFYGQPTYTGVSGGTAYTGQPFNQLPAIAFGGFDPPVSFNDVSPRAGVIVDLTGTGHTVLKFNFARYVGQLGYGKGPIAAVKSPAGLTYVTYPWVDVNGDGYIQPNEIVLTAVPLGRTPGYDYNNPSSIATSGDVDPHLSADQANEIVLSLEKQLLPAFAVSASYVWRKYSNARWNDTTDWTSADYTPVGYTPAAGNCPPGARCPTVTYFTPTRPIPSGYILTNQPDFWRGYQGFELTARKRLSKGWMLNASFSYNDARVHYDSPRAYEDPTNVENLNDGQYAPESTSTGLGNVFVNATWIFRVSGSWRTPLLGINVGGFYDSRSGYPFTASIRTPVQPRATYGAGIASVYLDTLGDNRLDTLRTLDLRIDRRFNIGRLAIVPAMDVFNVLNAGTPLSIQPVQNASTANEVSSILPPRVVRFGIRAEW